MLNTPRSSIAASALTTLTALASLAIPLYVIRPFRPQGVRELHLALHVRDLAPWLTAIAALLTLALLLRAWPIARTHARAALVTLCLLTCATAALTHINLFEQMFHPYPNPTFASAAASPIAPTDKLLSLTLSGQTHAFPIRTLGYHHIVNDTLAGVPIAATYCTLCHTGLIWDRRLNGRTLYFILAGINNGNALLRDTQTGSIWQQSTGEAIYGPLQGSRLTLLPADELTFALWTAERPTGLILRPDANLAPLYEPANWETHIATTHVVVDTSSTHIDPHTLMLGLTLGPSTKAFPIQAILSAHLIQDTLNGQPILLVTGADNTSIRAFHATDNGQPLTFLPTAPGLLTDTATHSTWNFTGCATAGPLTHHCLPPLESHKDYWFDWFHHHPTTLVGHG